MRRLYLSVDPRLRHVVLPSRHLCPGLGLLERALVGTLASLGEVAFPGVVFLAAELTCSPQTVRRACGRLRELKWLTIDRRSRADGGSTTHRYRLWIPGNNATGSVPPCQIGSPPPFQIGMGLTLNSESEEQHHLRDAGDAAKPASPWLDVDKWLGHFRETCQKYTGHRPAIVFGRDRVLGRQVLKTCPDLSILYEVTSDWIIWRRKEEKVVTVTAFAGACEAAYQKWLIRKGKFRPAGKGRRPDPRIVSDLVYKRAVLITGSANPDTLTREVRERAQREVETELGRGVDK